MVGLLTLVEEPGNVSRACQVMACPWTRCVAWSTVEDGGAEALRSATRGAGYFYMLFVIPKIRIARPL